MKENLRFNMNVHDAIHLERAVRESPTAPLPEEVILAVLNTGRRVQSSKQT